MSEGPGAASLALVALAAVIVGLIAISAESLWIDEFASLVIADHRDFDQVVTAAWGSSQSDGQMPLFMAWLWAWIRAFGHGEWVLRSANIPWFAAGAVALVYGCTRARLASVPVIAACVLVSPVLWFYMNEARPYVMQFAGSAMFLVPAIALAGASPRRPEVVGFIDAALVGVGAVLLAGTSLLGALWLLTGVPVYALIAYRSRWRFNRGGRAVLAASNFLLLVLAVYYIGTLSRGARAARIDASLWTSIGSIGYEMLGLIGLGPGRLELRATNAAVLRDSLWILAPACAALLGILFIGFRRRLAEIDVSGRRVLVVLGLVAIPPIPVLLAFGQIADFRVLARHAMPVAPALLIVVAAALTTLSRGGRRGVLLATVFFGIWTASSLSVRFADRHAKDDYRRAADVARVVLDGGGRVWWLAMNEGAVYYGLPWPGEGSADPAFVDVQNVTELPDGPSPDLVLVSKPDLYDRHGTVETYAADEMRLSCEFPAFRAYAGSGLATPLSCEE